MVVQAQPRAQTVTARERKVRELVNEALTADRNLAPFKDAAFAARYVAVKLLAEIDALTQETNKAVRTAAKGWK